MLALQAKVVLVPLGVQVHTPALLLVSAVSTMPVGRVSVTLGTLLTGLAQQQQAETTGGDTIALEGRHRVLMRDGSAFEGTWEEIVQALRDSRDAGRPLDQYMASEARRHYGATGNRIAAHAPEDFIRGSADAGLLRIIR